MATLMLMPLLGQTMEEGTIIKWFKQEGDSVTQGEPLLEVMTDKVNMEVEAPEGGVLRKILAKQDEAVPVQAPIAIIGSADESIDDLLRQVGGEKNAAEVPERGLKEHEPWPAAELSPEPAPSLTQPMAVASGEEGRVFASPSARRLARERGIDIAALAGRGTGPGGRIVEKDVLDYLASTKATPLAGKMAQEYGLNIGEILGTGMAGKVRSEDVTKAAARPSIPPLGELSIGERIPFAGLRKAVADSVSKSAREAVSVTLVTEVDMTEAASLRRQVMAEFEKTHDTRISFTDIIVKAAARAILDKPIVNSSLQGENIVIHDRVNIGIATAIESGLVVPVVKDVVSKSLPAISAEIKELVARARENKTVPDDYSGGTFTITNLGGYGVDSFDPVITPGQSAILGVCRIADKPAVVNGRVEIRSLMNLCLTFDHRVMDGAPAAEYLARLKTILESPYLIFV